ncbi:hypothetical protein OC846_001223 [Tilletia horrida]|uniref:DUF202 domain-containing protein n=1 Tax=Tilletia horrida TaxID=155126 RepID=A0AAN6GTF8_9BASI|nr:hypothetical protein OC846_001223 [Tilletia horrida]KAK0569298.1 hypothetical protein OC861_001115 [Tilletia horrida]
MSNSTSEPASNQASTRTSLLQHPRPPSSSPPAERYGSTATATPVPVDHPPARPSAQSPSVLIYTKNNVLDLRAAQRTFDGAYTRTALSQLSYAVVILRLFQTEFYPVGIAYVILSVGLLGIGILRYRLTMESPEETPLHDDHHPPQTRLHQHQHQPIVTPLPTRFKTAGDVVAVATAFTIALQIALLVLILRL